MSWEIVIGLETHAQLSTRSKIFSGAATAFGAAPNTQACGVDIALPGTLPVLNRGAVERAIRFALAVGGELNRTSVFARKNYFYPDLPKGYQISQYEAPIVAGGALTILAGGAEKVVRLTRAHLEEDAGKSLHEDFHGASGIDLNRAGTPLLEIVSEPDMRSAEEAVAYARTLHALVRWIEICDGNMQEGSFRCDANVSVRRPGAPLGTRCEIKNLNSFRFLERAIEHEARRQIEILEAGGRIDQETRLYDPERDETRSLRSKEEAHDYRYFPDPDLLPLAVSEQWIAEIRSRMPELPAARRARFESRYKLSPQVAAQVTASRDKADFFERSLMKIDTETYPEAPRDLANVTVGELTSQMNERGLEFSQSPVSPEQIGRVQALVLDGTISGKIAKDVRKAMWEGEGDPDAIVARRGLRQISDAGALEAIVAEVLAANPRSVEEFRAGKEKALNALVGQVMKATKGKANPQQVNDLLKGKLSG
ncbi:MAG: Asp-tRNA(Asn)/Glu-tRNA(Gln) amidotransferase subunit GatB [Burkholderiales bacterium]